VGGIIIKTYRFLGLLVISIFFFVGCGAKTATQDGENITPLIKESSEAQRAATPVPSNEATLAPINDTSDTPNQTYSLKNIDGNPQLVSKIYDINATIQKINQENINLISLNVKINKVIQTADNSATNYPFKPDTEVEIKFDENLSDMGSKIYPKIGDEITLTIGQYQLVNTKSLVWGSNFQWFYYKEDGGFLDYKGNKAPAPIND
jgi:FlaG/FlaF family flagellin (archaellin)